MDFNNLAKSISEHEIFYTRLSQFLIMVKLCYGGSAVKAYLLRHKNIQKFLTAKLHQESEDIDELYASLHFD